MKRDYITPKERTEQPIDHVPVEAAPVEAVRGMTRVEALTLIASIGALLITAVGMWLLN
jgi:hypothetical protein